jgi:hypothetical protein
MLSFTVLCSRCLRQNDDLTLYLTAMFRKLVEEDEANLHIFLTYALDRSVSFIFQPVYSRKIIVCDAGWLVY